MQHGHSREETAAFIERAAKSRQTMQDKKNCNTILLQIARSEKCKYCGAPPRGNLLIFGVFDGIPGFACKPCFRSYVL